MNMRSVDVWRLSAYLQNQLPVNLIKAFTPTSHYSLHLSMPV